MGDCREILPLLVGMGAAAVVTDPPYDLERKRYLEHDTPGIGWLDSARAAARTAIFTIGPTAAFRYPAPDWMLAWVRPGGAAHSLAGGFSHWSPVLLYGKARFPVDVYVKPTRMYPPGFPHPCPKPEALVTWMVEHVSEPGDLVIDPFCGSGTTLRVCKDLGRRAIGIEIDRGYAEFAARRLPQGVLF